MTSCRLARIGALAAVLVGVACRDGVGPALGAPATLSIYPDAQKFFGLGLGLGTYLVPLVRNAQGDTLPVPGGLVLASRNSAIVSVDSSAFRTVGAAGMHRVVFLTGRATGTTWVVATLSGGPRVLTDSVEISVLPNAAGGGR